MANVIPLPKTNPLTSVETDIRPISLTPIAAKVFDSIIMKWFDDNMVMNNIDDKKFGGLCVISTTDALVEITGMRQRTSLFAASRCHVRF